MWKIFFEYMDKSKITLTGKGSDISLRLAMKYDNLYNREAVRAEYQRWEEKNAEPRSGKREKKVSA